MNLKKFEEKDMINMIYQSQEEKISVMKARKLLNSFIKFSLLGAYPDSGKGWSTSSFHKFIIASIAYPPILYYIIRITDSTPSPMHTCRYVFHKYKKDYVIHQISQTFFFQKYCLFHPVPHDSQTISFLHIGSHKASNTPIRQSKFSTAALLVRKFRILYI